MNIQQELSSGSELEDEEFTCDDTPIHVEILVKKESEKVIKKQKSFKSYTRPTSSKKMMNHRPSQNIEK